MRFNIASEEQPQVAINRTHKSHTALTVLSYDTPTMTKKSVITRLSECDEYLSHCSQYHHSRLYMGFNMSFKTIICGLGVS